MPFHFRYLSETWLRRNDASTHECLEWIHGMRKEVFDDGVGDRCHGRTWKNGSSLRRLLWEHCLSWFVAFCGWLTILSTKIYFLWKIKINLVSRPKKIYCPESIIRNCPKPIVLSLQMNTHLQVRTATRPIRITELVFIMPVRIYNKNVSWLSSRRVLKWTRRVCNITTYHCLNSDCQCL